MSSLVGRFFVSGTMLQRLYQTKPLRMSTATTRWMGGGGIQRPPSYYAKGCQQPHPTALAGGSFLSRMRMLMLPQPLTATATSTSIPTRSKHTMKTHKGIAKRFKVRGNGSLRRACSGRQHNTGWKSRRRINKLGLGSTVKTKAIDRGLKICLGILGKQKRKYSYVRIAKEKESQIERSIEEEKKNSLIRKYYP